MRAIVRLGLLTAASVVLVSCGSRGTADGEKAAKSEKTGAISQATLQEDAGLAIFLKWLSLGGAPVVGNASGSLISAPGDVAKIQLFEQGVIIYSVDYGPVFLTHFLFERWLYYQGQFTADGTALYTYLGVPIKDVVTTTPGRREAIFERGMIVDADGAGDFYSVYGEIYLRYMNYSIIGRPMADQVSSPGGGRSQTFEFGQIHLNPEINQAFILTGDVLTKWVALGAAGGSMGHPTGDVTNVAQTGQMGRFQNGAIFYGAGVGTWELKGEILAAYEAKYAGPAGILGFPNGTPGVTDAGDEYANFERGVIVNRRRMEPNHSLNGIYAFQTADFFLQRIEALGNRCFTCDAPDVYVGMVLTRDGTSTAIKRLPAEDDEEYGDDPSSHDFNQAGEGIFSVGDGYLRHSTRITALVDVMDDNGIQSDENYGRLLEVYDINNLWGLTVNPVHTVMKNDGTDKGATATFTVRRFFPYDKRDMRGDLWWSFKNFNTYDVSYDTFAETFLDVDPNETWFHPFNQLYFLAYQKAAEFGNCFGMSVESIYAQWQRSPYSEPIHQYFNDTQDGRELTFDGGAHDGLMHVLNVKHGYQLGADELNWMIAYFAKGFVRQPQIGAIKVLDALGKGDLPIISVTEDALVIPAHTVRPYEFRIGIPQSQTLPPDTPAWYKCSHSEFCDKILIMDPTYPTSYTTPRTYRGEGAIEISKPGNRWFYSDKKNGDLFTGGYLFVLPAHTFDHTPITIMGNPVALVDSGTIFLTGSTADIVQVSDAAGHSLFKSGVTFPPSLWSDFRAEDDPLHIDNFAPIPSFDGGGGVHMFAGNRQMGATHTYQVTPKAGTPAGTPYEMTFHSGKLAAHFKIPSTPGAVETFHARGIETPDKAISIDAASGAPPKPITWLIAGANKHHWIECAQMTLNPSQKLTARLENVGERLILENDGQPTSCNLTVQTAAGAAPIALGVMEIPSGTSQLSTVAPVTTVQVTGGTLGQNDWYVAPPTVTLTAQDLSGQGIQAIEYSFDQTNWTPYTAPFVYTQQGATTLYYRARDNTQGQEAAKKKPFKLDTQLPSVTGTVGTTGSVTLNYTATDPTPGSGVAGINTIVRGANGSPTTSFNAGSSGVLTLPTTCSAVEYWSQDVAGNQQSPHVVVADTVSPTFLSVPPAIQSTKCTPTAGLSIGTATASDDCGTVTIANNAPAKFPIGTTTVIWTATDAVGHTTTATQLVTTTLFDDASCCPTGTNIIMGTSAANTILGTAGDDCILGLGGNDTISSQGGNDYISGGAGNDTIAAGAGNDSVWGGDGNDTIDGSTGDDFISGGTGTNTCAGGAGVNAIAGCTTTAGCTAACCSTNTCSP